ncbi:MAG: alpha/beta hydrolase [Verrucomicrobiota bacterium]
MIFAAIIVVAGLVLLAVGCSSLERTLLFHPTHLPETNGLAPWKDESGTSIGFSRAVAAPKTVWLLLHGNGGQAAGRGYALSRFSPGDAVYIMEYPGFGLRAGSPSRTSFNHAAEEAYRLLRRAYPNTPVCVAGESLGSGPASFLATLDRPPEKVVLVVPFARLSSVARDHYPALLVTALLRSDWDNIAALSRYKGPVDIFAARGDAIIPVAHAITLAGAVPQAKLTILDGGHNEWSNNERVRIVNP